MREVAGAILVLAGSVLVAAGIIADAASQSRDGHGYTGYILGAVVGLTGLVKLLTDPLRRAWDSIPIDGKSPPKRRP
jgi:hypothetical protein